MSKAGWLNVLVGSISLVVALAAASSGLAWDTLLAGFPAGGCLVSAMLDSAITGRKP